MKVCQWECMIEAGRLILFLLISVQCVRETRIEIFQGAQERVVIQDFGTLVSTKIHRPEIF